MAERLASAPSHPETVTPPPRRAALIFIFVTVALDMLAMGMIAPVLPDLIKIFLGGSTERAAEMLGVFGTVWALMQFVSSPILGSLSDHFGRRPVILLSCLGMGLDYFVLAAAPTLAWLFVGRVISGITSANIPTAMAYIADVTPPAERSRGFGMISAAFGLGFVLGPAMGGVLGNTDPRLPFWVAGLLSVLNALYGVFVLPESLEAKNRSAFRWRTANPVGSLNLLRQRRSLVILSVVLFLSYLVHQVFGSVYVLYAVDRYGWSNRTVGLSLAVVGISSAVVGGLLVRPAVARLGETRAMMTGLLLGAAGFAIFGLASGGTAFVLGIPVMALWGLSSPAAQGMMTRDIGPNQQGQLQGAISSLRGIAGLLGPALFSFAFAMAIDPHRQWHMPGLPFLLAAALLVGSLLLATFTLRQRTV